MGIDYKKKVFVVVDGFEYFMDKAKKEIQDEGYDYDFHFGTDCKALDECDEVWCFGDCTKSVFYLQARTIGKDLWLMG